MAIWTRAIYFLRLVIGLLAVSGWSEITSAEQVKYISKSDQALVEFLSLVESAQRSITLATFIFKPCDESTQLVMDALARRAAAGVKVKVVLDSVTQGLETKQPLVDFFYQNGIELDFTTAFCPRLIRVYI